MKTFWAATVTTSIFFISPSAFADHERMSMALRGGLGTSLEGDASINVAARLEYPAATPLSVEAFVLVPYGVGVSMGVTGLKIKDFRLRLFDLGIFWGREPTNAWVPHSWSIMLGAGLEWEIISNHRGSVWPCVALTADYRAFLPDPSRVLPRYGDFGKEIYLSALREGQWILGLAWIF